jgi:assimilatory nitrate reductase catalytic subunit
MQAFIAMHWGPEFLSGRNSQGQPGLGVNVLTTSSFCPTSKQPELKHSAVQITPLAQQSTWSFVGMAWLPAEHVWQARRDLQQRLTQFDFASLVPFVDRAAELADQTPRTGLLFRASSTQACSPALQQELLNLLGMDTPESLRYQDSERHQLRILRLSAADNLGQRSLHGFALAGDTQSARWLQELLEQGQSLDWPARQWLQASSNPPQSTSSVSRQVCSCLNVREDAIAACLQKQPGETMDRLSALQQRLECGTRCGSCLPELRRLVRQVPYGDQTAATSCPQP